MTNVKCFMVEPVWVDGSVEGLRLIEGRCIREWRRADTGEVFEQPYQAGVGSMWYSPWIEANLREFPGNRRSYHFGPDGKVLCVQTPGGLWIIDSRCSNCTKPDDNEHFCWVRHGTPPNVHVDKNGITCNAGAGSIQAGNWHGYLHHGVLSENG